MVGLVRFVFSDKEIGIVRVGLVGEWAEEIELGVATFWSKIMTYIAFSLESLFRGQVEIELDYLNIDGLEGTLKANALVRVGVSELILVEDDLFSDDDDLSVIKTIHRLLLIHPRLLVIYILSYPFILYIQTSSIGL
jgi:hypothetical protein